jgi:hypothetical protein
MWVRVFAFERAAQVKRNGLLGIFLARYQARDASSFEASHEALTHAPRYQDIYVIQWMRRMR